MAVLDIVSNSATPNNFQKPTPPAVVRQRCYHHVWGTGECSGYSCRITGQLRYPAKVRGKTTAGSEAESVRGKSPTEQEMGGTDDATDKIISDENNSGKMRAQSYQRQEDRCLELSAVITRRK